MELAQAGAMLEYDTFYRPKYEPKRMYFARKADQKRSASRIALRRIAEAELWSTWQRPGLPAINSRTFGSGHGIRYQPSTPDWAISLTARASQTGHCCSIEIFMDIHFI
jgi:hypothetical protein